MKIVLNETYVGKTKFWGQGFKNKQNLSIIPSKNYMPPPKDSFLIDKNYNNVSVSFGKSVPFETGKEISKKLSGVLYQMNANDIAIVSKDIIEAKKYLNEALGSIKSIINNIFYIEEKEFNGTFLMAKNKSEQPYLKNISNSLLYKRSDEGQDILLKKGEAMAIPENFRTNGIEFEIKHQDGISLDDLIKIGVKRLSSNDNQIMEVKKLNKKIVDQLIITPEEEVKKGASKIMFKDVGGQDKAIQELKETIIWPIKYPGVNTMVDHGVILEGGPGTGKSLLARAAANESGAYFVKINATDFENKFIGETERLWRDLFEEAKTHEPSVIFIDEMDAVMSKRGSGESSKHENKIVNQILGLMDDIEKEDRNIFVLGATNRLDIIDEAISRSGRFGKHIHIGNPDLKGCEQILKIHTAKHQIDPKFNYSTLAKNLNAIEASGADIAKITNESKKNLFRRNGIYQKMEDGTFQIEDIKDLKIKTEDFNQAIMDFIKQNKKEPIEEPKPITLFDFVQSIATQTGRGYAESIEILMREVDNIKKSLGLQVLKKKEPIGFNPYNRVV